MGRAFVGHRITKSFCLSGLVGAFLLLVAVSMFGQEPKGRGVVAESGDPYPRLPGALTRAPEGLRTDAPFDVEKFFTVLPRDRNAAPLYLDAFFEFSDGLAVCFPAGPERESRQQLAKNRQQRYLELEAALAKDPKAVPGTAIDEVLKLYDSGFRKLALAQKREQCVFETSLALEPLLPHIQGARQATRVASLKMKRALELQDFDGAVRAVEMVLRLARDLQPRGGIMTQLVSSALTQVAGSDMVPRILADPGLRVQHCDRVLKLLTGHDAKSTDGYSEGLRTEYLITRLTITDLVLRQSETARRIGLNRGESVVKAVLAPIFNFREPGASKLLPDDADAQIARTSTAELATKLRELDQYYRTLLAMEGTPYASRISKASALKMAAGDDLLSRVIALMSSSLEPFTQAISRGTTTLRADECLVALRRWQLQHQGSPPDLASLVKGAGLKAVPVDPYDGKAMRLAMVEGQPIVYSVGRDGNDDGGLKDSNRDQQPVGDLLYRLTKP
jgi:hypothetical protein